MNLGGERKDDETQFDTYALMKPLKSWWFDIAVITHNMFGRFICRSTGFIQLFLHQPPAQERLKRW